VRVSGPKALTALTTLTGLTSNPTPRLATVRTIKDPATQQVLDKGLFLWFPGKGHKCDIVSNHSF